MELFEEKQPQTKATAQKEQQKQKRTKACKTMFEKGIVEKGEALSMFELLKDSIEWEEGVRSRIHGFTRKAKAIGPMEYPLILELVAKTLQKIQKKNKTNYVISHIYLNYYQDGSHFCPNHSHPGTHQLVISLGGTRTLQVNKKNFVMENGDAILFGSALHGVPKEANSEPRISIATFMIAIP